MTHYFLHLSALAIFYVITAATFASATQIPVNAMPREVASAASAISGSRQPDKPGITDHLLKRSNRPGRPEINITYPSLGRSDIDADIARWAANMADAFDDCFVGENNAPDTKDPYELSGTYAVSCPSAAAVSLTFDIWTYTGGAHGNRDIITLNYSLITGQRLDIVDIFEDVDAALELMSQWSRKELFTRFAGSRMERMIREGTEPVIENFSSLTLTPMGVRIRFQPYQVAPWAAGAQDVDIPLEELADARPFLPIWR
ncbi:MAG: DUF3298 and DUF4163 domain-containing protein [Desulfovibrio sp.]|jgi:hypothetical protein|nr:DUF3298 and DUF4163 domain-containing protein [Desulfovibrio sp.]